MATWYNEDDRKKNINIKDALRWCLTMHIVICESDESFQIFI